MRIMMLDETGTLILDADVDTQKRRVTTLNLEENYPAVVSAFVGLSVLSGYVANELQDGDLAELWKIGSSLTAEGKVEWQPTLKPALTFEQMAKEMGLHPCSNTAEIVCEDCKEAFARAYRRKGQVLIGWCHGCLPAAFETHVREQAALDRLVEADEPDRPDRAERTDRPEAPTCEGGCE